MRIEQLTFTRFLAAIIIVVFHFGKGVFPFNLPGLTTLISFGYIGVSYFFTLSGFVMIVAYGKDGQSINTKNYYINRLAKIYPVYIVALLLSLLAIRPAVTAPKLGAEVVLLQSFIPKYLPSYNLPDWSLSVELLFYLLFPLLLNYFYNKSSLLKTGLVISGLWILSQVINSMLANSGDHTDTYRNFIYYNPIGHLNEFLAGNLAGLAYLHYCRKNYFANDRPLLILAVVAVLGVLLLRWMQLLGINWPVNFHNGLLVVFFVPLILLLALNKGYFSKVLSNPVLVFLGEISYCIYILQLPLSTLFTGWFKLNNPVAGLYLFVIFLIVCSSAVYLFVEIPGKKLIKKYLKNL